uniref:Phosphatidylinositol 5-phosphate 4-kinase type-2 gamma n=1 Tax=Geospiza parvula TaxID=87175 RepID=A0A8U8BH32_GEOPR
MSPCPCCVPMSLPCPHVPMSPCPHGACPGKTAVSPCPGCVPAVSPCPHVPGWVPHVPMSPCPCCVPMSLPCPHVPAMSPCPHVPMSLLCPHVPAMSPCPHVPVSHVPMVRAKAACVPAVSPCPCHVPMSLLCPHVPAMSPCPHVPVSPQYVVQCHGQTLLPRFLGMYRVSVDSEDTYLLVMRNLFSHRLPVHRKYDLKGSLVDREASDKEKGKELPTLKDVDFLNKNEKVFVEEEQQREFMDKLKRDVEFLVQQKLMDYSLLLGIHEVERGEQEDEEELEEEELGGGDEGGRGGPYGTSPEGLGGLLNSCRPPGPGEFDPGVDVYAVAWAGGPGGPGGSWGSWGGLGAQGALTPPCPPGAPRREVYFMGLIDVLTQYDARKKAAHAAKTVKHGAGAEISTVHPEQYAKRFLDFITNIFA